MIKKFFLCFFFLAGVVYLSAQEIQQQIVSSDGGSAITSSMQIDWTLGESFIDDGRTPNRWYTAGFHQPELIVQEFVKPQSVPASLTTTLDIVVVPNPVRSTLQIRWPDQTDNSVTAILSDVNGDVLLKQSLHPALGDDQLDVSSYSPGLYLLRFYNPEKELLQVCKITKIQ